MVIYEALCVSHILTFSNSRQDFLLPLISFRGREEQVEKLLSFAELANISGVEDLKIDNNLIYLS